MSLPQMSNAFKGWKQSITLIKITQAIVDGLTQEAQTTKLSKAVVQPLKLETLNQKPLETRSREWLEFHVEKKDDFAQFLQTNDKITFNKVTYKVLDVLNESFYNFKIYHAIRDFT